MQPNKTTNRKRSASAQASSIKSRKPSSLDLAPRDVSGSEAQAARDESKRLSGPSTQTVTLDRAKSATVDLTTVAKRGKVSSLAKSRPRPAEFSPLVEAVERLRRQIVKPAVSVGDSRKVLTAILLVVDGLRQPAVAILNDTLSSLRGKFFPTVKENRELVVAINAIRTALRIELTETATGQPVNIRCITTPGTRHGSFQLVTAGQKRRSLSSSVTFPSLKAELQKSDR